MSVRRSVFDEIGGFDEDVGRIGLIPLGAEETEFCIRLAQRRPGSRVVFEPAAVVHHRVTAATHRRSPTSAPARTRRAVSKAPMARLVGSPATRRPRRAATSARCSPPACAASSGEGSAGTRSGWKGAAGIITCLSTTGFWYARGRLGHRSKVDAVALERRGAAPRHEDPPARAVLPAGRSEARSGTSATSRSSWPPAATRCTSPASTSATRRSSDPGVTVHTLHNVGVKVPALYPTADRPLALPVPDPLRRGRCPGWSREVRPDVVHAHNWIINSYLPLGRGPAAAAGLLAPRLQPRLRDEAADVRGRALLRARRRGSASSARRTGTAPAAAR